MGTISHHEVKNNSSPWLTNLQQVISRLAQKEKKNNNNNTTTPWINNCFTVVLDSKDRGHVLPPFPPGTIDILRFLAMTQKWIFWPYSSINVVTTNHEIKYHEIPSTCCKEQRGKQHVTLNYTPRQRSTKGWCVIDTQNKVLCSWALSLLYWEPLIPLIAHKKSGSNSTNE